MSKSIKGTAEAQTAQILGAAFALGMSLGMVAATAADAADAPAYAVKTSGADHKVANAEYLKLHGASQDKVGGQVTRKGASVVKLHGQASGKFNHTLKLDGVNHKVNGQTTHKVAGADQPKP